jgi:hypothetical protein
MHNVLANRIVIQNKRVAKIEVEAEEPSCSPY